MIEDKEKKIKETPDLTFKKKKYKMDPRSTGEPIFRVQPNQIFGFVEKTFSQSATRWKL